MFLKRLTTGSTSNCSEQAGRLRELLDKADAVVVGAGAGLSASAGLSYSGSRFTENFADFIEKYGLRDMYSAGFYPYRTLEEYWAYWSRHIYLNRYDQPAREPYQRLRKLLEGREYFIITTNVDHSFQLAGFDKRRLFYTQGDYGLWQCVKPCHQKTYDNEDMVRRMVREQKEMRIPQELVPNCPVCGRPMAMNLRCDASFVQDEGWYHAKQRYEAFLDRHRAGRVLYLELGVGANTPVIIKYPFWQFARRNPDAVYVCINNGEADAPHEIRFRSLCINRDIGEVLASLAQPG